MKRIVSIALCLIIALTGAGCGSAATPVPDREASSQPTLEVFEDSGPTPSFHSSYAPEYPAIDAEPVFANAAVAKEATQTASTPAAEPVAAASVVKEIRSVWISYLDLDPLLRGKSKSQFSTSIGKVYDNLAEMGFNTVIVQVRPFGDALYPSEYFPWSYIATGTEGKDPGFDPLDIMVQAAHKRDLRLEAWINPYRVRATASKNALCEDNQAKIWLESDNNAVVRYGDIISYNPASPEAQSLIVNGVREIVKNYKIDAVHIDDYFYPVTDAAFDAGSYSAYQANGGKLSLADWRRSNVETLLKRMYKAIKDENSAVKFGISPASNIKTNYDVQYLDVAKITANAGYCDYICPQIYFGYNNEVQPYATTLKQWSNVVTSPSVELYVGIAAYKVGKVDSWAGSGKDEWVGGTELLASMVETARGYSNYKGFAVYRYDSLFNPDASVKAQVQLEKEALSQLMED
ncbi:family 10 glycosylhydrolase [Oscillospiraceae bacterium MB08-C2-2]|nr:family 10 glycosylhydrolase [Oscillospiraceae bacterium MB08-C2-2]